MWYKVSKFILRNRIPIFIGLILFTLFMGYKGKDIQMSYSMAKVVPPDDPSYQQFIKFQELFGTSSNIMVLAVEHDPLFDKDFFNAWMELGEKAWTVDGVEEVLGLNHGYYFTKNTEERKFELQQFPNGPISTEAEMDSIEQMWKNLPFYENVLYNPQTNVTLMAITFNDKNMRSVEKVLMVEEMEEHVAEFEQKHGITVHRSGLPFIKAYRIKLITSELYIVLMYAIIVLVIVLIILFRSAWAVVFPFIVVAIAAVWAMGLMVLLGYKITILTSLVPNLLVIIGIPNCIYLVNKYHAEYRKHGNKVRALSRMIERIGFVTLFANLTTAIGFGVFVFTGSKLLEEFGVVAGVMITLLFFLSLVIIPIMFSFLPPPGHRAVKHLDRTIMDNVLGAIDTVSIRNRPLVYTLTAIILTASAYGVTKLTTDGYMLDDVPKEATVYKDLKFLEKHFTGVMPLEILVDTKRPNGALKSSTLAKIDELQDTLTAHPLFAKPTSVVNGLKFATQAYYNGNPERYRLPRSSGLTPELSFVMRYLSGMKDTAQSSEKLELMNSFLDSTRQIARISTQIPDIGSGRIDELYTTLDSLTKPIFEDSTYSVTYTGSSVVAYEGFRFLVKGLVNSVGMAFLLISIIMASLFRTVRMLLIALIPNLIPLLLTAGLMGYFQIALKPSTVLVFSVAFGISVDFTIHFLAKYRQELTRHRWDIAKTVTETINETGTSMIYTSLILFFGFITFTLSSFDGTKYMGLLVSITLVASLFSNMFLLPALLLSFDKVPKRKRYLLDDKEQA